MPIGASRLNTLSAAGGAATFSVAAAGGATSVNEGSSLTFNVSTTNVSNGTNLYWTANSNTGDFSRTQKTITAVAQAQISTAQSKFGGASAVFDGGDDYLQIGYQSNLRFGTGNFTIESWVNPTARSRQYPTIFANQANSTAGAIVLYDRHSLATTKFTVYIYNLNSGALALTSTTSVVNGTWYHLAVVRNGTTIKLYVNGVEESSATLPADFNIDAGDTTDSYIGRTEFGLDTSYHGYIDEVRVSNIVRYTANFTPSASAFSSDSNTVLLMHMNGANASTTFTDDNVPASSGQFTIASNAGSFSLTPTADVTTEGAETFTVSVRTDSTSGTVVATSASITINDTSTAPVSGSWTTFSLNNVVSSVSQYTGVGKGSIGIHGVQNTDNLVLSIAAQNSARTSWSITPMVVNLTTGAMAKGSSTTLTATNTGANYLDATVAGDDTGAISYGMASVLHFDGVKYLHRMYGVTFTNWGSISPSTVPTITLSSAFTDTLQVNSVVNTAYAGGNRFVSVWRDNAGGDLTAFKAYTYTGSGAPTAYSPKSSADGNRGTGYIATWRAGITVGTNFAGHSAQAGNNANPLVTFVTTGNATNCRNYSKADVIASDSRGYFDGDTLRDVSSSNFFIHGASKGSTGQHEIYAGQVTNANTPTSLPTITYGAVNNSGTVGSLVSGDKLTKAYKIVPSSNVLYITPIILDPATRALTFGTQVATTSPGDGNNAYRGFYHSTYGQWVINAQYDGNTNIHISKLNP
jgi:hypothetical protein